MRKATVIILSLLLCLALSACTNTTATPTATLLPSPTVAPTPTPLPTLTFEAAVTTFVSAAAKNKTLPEFSLATVTTVVMSGITAETTGVIDVINDAENPMMHIKQSMGTTAIGEYYLNNSFLAMDLLDTKEKIALPADANILTGEGLGEMFAALSLGDLSGSTIPTTADIKSCTAAYENGGWRLTMELTDAYKLNLVPDETTTISALTYEAFIDADGYLMEYTLNMTYTSAGFEMSMKNKFALQDPSIDVVITFPDLTAYQETSLDDLTLQ